MSGIGQLALPFLGLIGEILIYGWQELAIHVLFNLYFTKFISYSTCCILYEVNSIGIWFGIMMLFRPVTAAVALSVI